MTLTTQVTPVGVRKVQRGLWNIAVSLSLYDEGVEVLTKVYTVETLKGDSPASKRDELMTMIQRDVADYEETAELEAAIDLPIIVAGLQAGIKVRAGEGKL